MDDPLGNPEQGENSASATLDGPDSSAFLTDSSIAPDNPNTTAMFGVSGDSVPPETEPEFSPPVEVDEPTLRLGDQSVDGWVEYLQGLLNTKGYGPLPLDGNLDNAVLAAVRNFQATARDQHGGKLQVDGVVGHQTWAALREEEPREPSTDGRVPHTYVEHGPKARFQTEDHAIDYFPGEPDVVQMTAVNTGDQVIHPLQFQATARITFPGGEQHTFHVPLENFNQPAQPGDLFFQGPVESEIHRKLDPGSYLIEAYMPAELGGNETSREVVVP